MKLNMDSLEHSPLAYWSPTWSGVSSVLLLGLLVLGCIGCEASHNGSSASRSQTLVASSSAGAPLDLFVQRPIGDGFTAPPKISFVKIHDLDEDGLLDVLVCDCTKNAICWIRQVERGRFEEQVLAEQIIAPAGLACDDIDGDGDTDLLVAVLGQLYPTNDPVGSVVILENVGQMRFEPRVLLDKVARVADVQGGDLDGDGDLDLVVTQFGYYEGGIQWLENQGNWKFESHQLQSLAGGIHGVVADIDKDGHVDIIALVSQEIESIFAFYGNGAGAFRESKLYSASNPDFGSAGISLFDMDRDGDLDILYCNGDAFDYSPPRPWPWHGFQWLENLGQAKFEVHRVLDFGGAVNARAVDFDGDNDIDVFVSSTFNDWDSPESQSLILLKNAGNMNFTSHPLANSPTHIQAIDVGDLDGDGRLDLVTGGMHVSAPYDRVERVVWWQNIAGLATDPKP